MYRIIGADGNQYGPISAEQLRQWVAEGRANAQTKILAEGTTEWKPLSEFPEFFGTAAPPPGALPPPPSMPTMQPLGSFPVSAASDQVNGPAIGLIVLGALNIVLALARGVMTMLGIGMNTLQSSNNADADKVLALISTFGLGFAIVGVLGGIFILFGGIKMRRLESYGLCMAASIIAMIPCLSACCPVGLAIGIWSLVILSKPEVKSAFH
jgi:GYF domain 2